MHPRYLGWQVDWPLFVKIPFTAYGKYWKKGEHFNWHSQIGATQEPVAQLYNSGFVYHNRELENFHRVGDRLGSMSLRQLHTVMRLLNTKFQGDTPSKQDYNKHKCKNSQVIEKQIAFIRNFLNQQPHLVEYYYQEVMPFALSEPEQLETESD